MQIYLGNYRVSSNHWHYVVLRRKIKLNTGLGWNIVGFAIFFCVTKIDMYTL